MEPPARLCVAHRRGHEQLRRGGRLARPHRRLRRVVPQAGAPGPRLLGPPAPPPGLPPQLQRPKKQQTGARASTLENG